MRDKKTFKKSMIGFLVASVMLFAMSITAFAADGATAAGAATGIKQTGSSKTSVDIEWTSTLNEEYLVGISETKDGTYYNANNSTYTSSSNKKYIYNLSAGRSYYVKVYSYTKVNNTWTLTGESDPFEVVTAPEYTDNVKQTAGTKKSVTLTWDSVSGATGYKLISDSKNTKYVTTNKATVAASVGKKVYEYIYSYRKSASGYVAMSSSYAYSGYLYASPSAPTNVANVNKNYLTWQPTKSSEVTIRWSDNTNYYYPDGYQLQIYTVNGKKKLATVSKITSTRYTITSAKVRKAIKNKGFMIKVRAYKKNGSATLYSSWAKKVIIPQAAAKLSANGNSTSSVKVTWPKVSNVDHYVVYVSKNINTITGNGTWTKKTVSKSKTSYVIKGLKKNKKFAVCVVPVVKVNGKKYTASRTWYTYSYLY